MERRKMTGTRRFTRKATPAVADYESFDSLRQQAVMDRLEVQGFFTNENIANNTQILRRMNEEMDREYQRALVTE